MKKLLLALLALSSVAFTVPPVQACGINAGEYSLGMCTSTKKTYYYRVVNASKHAYITYRIGNRTYHLEPKTYREHSLKGKESYQGVEFDKNIFDSGWSPLYVYINASKQDSIRVVANKKTGRVYPRVTDR